MASDFSRTGVRGVRLQSDRFRQFGPQFARPFAVPPGHPERLKTFDYMGPHRYSIRFCTFERKPRFAEQHVVDFILKQFLRAAAEERFEILVYCFMPDHVHLLIQGASEDSDCKRFVFRAKQYSGFYYSRHYHTQHLWQRYCFERVLRSDEATLIVARYIVANPVRAGLVSRPEDYPFVGSCVMALRELLESVVETTRSD